MRGRIRNEHHHLARILPPVHIQRLRERRRDRLGPIAAARRIQRRQVLVHRADVAREAKVLGDVRVVLRRVVAEGDEPDAQVLRRLQLARLEDVRADGLDVLRRGGDVGALAPCAVLDKYKITVAARGVRSRMYCAGV
jgi:hypothetical protein